MRLCVGRQIHGLDRWFLDNDNDNDNDEDNGKNENEDKDEDEDKDKDEVQVQVQVETDVFTADGVAPRLSGCRSGAGGREVPPSP